MKSAYLHKSSKALNLITAIYVKACLYFILSKANCVDKQCPKCKKGEFKDVNSKEQMDNNLLMYLPLNALQI